MVLNNRKLFGLLCGLVLVATIVVWQLWGNRYEIVLSEQQLVEKLNERFPFEKKLLFVVDLKFSNPLVSLEEGSDRITFGCEIETNLRLEEGREVQAPLRGTLTLSGNVRYDENESAFYLDNPRLERVDIAGVPEKWSGKVRDASSRALSEYLNRAPLYRLRPTDVKKAVAKLVLRDVRVSEKRLILTMGVG